MALNFSWLAERAAHYVGRPAAVIVTISILAISFPVFGVDVTNVVISVVSLLLLLLLQASQNRDGLALQIKVDELIRATQDARNELAGIDKLAEDEVEKLRED